MPYKPSVEQMMGLMFAPQPGQMFLTAEVTVAAEATSQKSGDDPSSQGEDDIARKPISSVWDGAPARHSERFSPRSRFRHPPLLGQADNALRRMDVERLPELHDITWIRSRRGPNCRSKQSANHDGTQDNHHQGNEPACVGPAEGVHPCHGSAPIDQSEESHDQGYTNEVADCGGVNHMVFALDQEPKHLSRPGSPAQGEVSQANACERACSQDAEGGKQPKAVFFVLSPELPHPSSRGVGP
jgi:hypothetical protein